MHSTFTKSRFRGISRLLTLLYARLGRTGRCNLRPNSRRSPRQIMHVVTTFVLAGVAVAAQAQTYTDLYNATASNANIENPFGVIAQGSDGNLYSTSLNGGTFFGAIYKVSPTGVEKVINNIGFFPASGLTLGTDGQFYGTDQNGGTSNCGQVYKVTAAGKSTILHNFNGTTEGCDPQSVPIQAANGLFYGTSNSVAYSVSSTGVFNILHTFTGPDGTDPVGALVQGNDGNFYGTTFTGGSNNFGVIYKMTPSGAVTVLHNFDKNPEGASPNFALIQATDGNFYGVTTAGGTFYGTVFQITPGGAFTVLHTFTNGSDGSTPSGALVQATDGMLYGATAGGGTSNIGTIFSLTTSGASYSVLFNFVQATGAVPSSGLVQHTNGKFYGQTKNGGSSPNCNTAGCGVFYSFDIGSSGFLRLAKTSGVELSKVGIYGQGFAKGSSVVKFGGVTATAITLSGSTYILATVPTGAKSGNVTVTTGSTTLTSRQKFSVLPAVLSFTPTHGPVGTAVTITGSGLTGTTSVTFNGVAASGFTVVSDTQITVTVPNAAINGKIKVTTPAGTATSKTNFTVG